MEEKKTTFVFYTEWIKYIEILEEQDIKELISIICDYVENLKEPKKPNLSDRLLMTWLFIKNQLDKDKTKYDKRCETSKINGKKGGRPKNLKNLKEPKKADNDNEYDNEYEYVNDNEDDIITTTNSNNIYEYIEKNFGRTLSPIEYETISEWEDTELTRYAIKKAIMSNKCSIGYISGILQNFKRNNITTVQQAQDSEEQFKKRKEDGEKYKGLSFREQQHLREQEILDKFVKGEI